jgi:hypothetical protein
MLYRSLNSYIKNSNIKINNYLMFYSFTLLIY